MRTEADLNHKGRAERSIDTLLASLEEGKGFEKKACLAGDGFLLLWPLEGAYGVV
jgi:hypothetical protein